MHAYVCAYIYIYMCTTWTDVKLLRWLHFTFQEFPFLICRGHRPIVDTCANEAIPQWGKRRLITSVYLHFWPSWQGAKPRTPTNRFFFRFYTVVAIWNLRSRRFWTTFTLYLSGYGEGLSQEPCWDYCQCLRFIWWCLWSRLSSRSTSQYLPLVD